MREEKSKFTAYMLWFFLGGFGAHFFYLHKPVWGVIKLITGNGCMIGWFIDLFLVGNMVDAYNAQVRADNMEQQLQQATTIITTALRQSPQQQLHHNHKTMQSSQRNSRNNLHAG